MNLKKFGWINKDGKLKRDENGNYRVFDSLESAEETRKYFAKNYDNPSIHQSMPEHHIQNPVIESAAEYKSLKSVELTDELLKS